MRENEYQAKLIKKLDRMFKGCIILKNDPAYIQGFPDLLILYKDKWAALEVKASANAPTQPNQPEYVEMCDYMSFSAFIYPENEDEVLYALQRSFKSRRTARVV